MQDLVPLQIFYSHWRSKRGTDFTVAHLPVLIITPTHHIAAQQQRAAMRITISDGCNIDKIRYQHG